MKILKFLSILLLIPSLVFGAGSRDFESGSSEYVTIGTPAALKYNRSFTLSIWTKPESTGTHALISYACRGYYFRKSSGTEKVEFIKSQIASIGVSNSALSTGLWQHVSVSVGAGGTANVNFYLNGASDGSTTTSLTFFDSANQELRVGAEENCIGSATSEYQDGVLAYAIIHSSELTQPLITNEVYLPGSTGTIGAFWPLWGESPEQDLSGNNNTGTLTGTTAVNDGPPVTFGGGLPL